MSSEDAVEAEELDNDFFKEVPSSSFNRLRIFCRFFAKLSLDFEAVKAAVICALWLRNKEDFGSANFRNSEFVRDHLRTSSRLALEASN